MKTKLFTRILAKKLTTVVFSSFLLVIISSANAEIYKWIDKNGQTHYSETPPVEQAHKAENIEQKIDLAKGKTQPITEQKETTESQMDSSEHPQSNYCKKQREALDVLQTNEYVKWQQNGQEEVLEGEAKQKKTQEIQLELDKYCQGLDASRSNKPATPAEKAPTKQPPKEPAS
jgi:hypothetical protein